jgi:hypothetical protein
MKRKQKRKKKRKKERKSTKKKRKKEMKSTKMKNAFPAKFFVFCSFLGSSNRKETHLKRRREKEKKCFP